MIHIFNSVQMNCLVKREMSVGSERRSLIVLFTHQGTQHNSITTHMTGGVVVGKMRLCT